MLTDIYQLCPPSFGLGILRIDSPTKHNREPYEQDKQFFALHKGRSLYLRGDYRNEFDIALETEEWLRLPRLQVLVTQVSIGVHLVTPVYRGKQFFYDNLGSDAEVALVLVEMQRRGGMNAAEWMAFESQWIERQRALTTLETPKDEVTH